MAIRGPSKYSQRPAETVKPSMLPAEKQIVDMAKAKDVAEGISAQTRAVLSQLEGKGGADYEKRILDLLASNNVEQILASISAGHGANFFRYLHKLPDKKLDVKVAEALIDSGNSNAVVAYANKFSSLNGIVAKVIDSVTGKNSVYGNSSANLLPGFLENADKFPEFNITVLDKLVNDPSGSNLVYLAASVDKLFKVVPDLAWVTRLANKLVASGRTVILATNIGKFPAKSFEKEVVDALFSGSFHHVLAIHPDKIADFNSELTRAIIDRGDGQKLASNMHKIAAPYGAGVAIELLNGDQRAGHMQTFTGEVLKNIANVPMADYEVLLNKIYDAGQIQLLLEALNNIGQQATVDASLLNMAILHPKSDRTVKVKIGLIVLKHIKKFTGKFNAAIKSGLVLMGREGKVEQFPDQFES